MDYPALTSPDGQTASVKYVVDNVQQSGNPYRSFDSDVLLFKSGSSVPSGGGAIEFASAVRKLASQDSGGIWKYEKNGSGDAAIGSSRTSNVLASDYNGGQGRAHFVDRLQNVGSARAAPVWLETSDAVGKYLCLYASIVGCILCPLFSLTILHGSKYVFRAAGRGSRSCMLT